MFTIYFSHNLHVSTLWCNVINDSAIYQDVGFLIHGINASLFVTLKIDKILTYIHKSRHATPLDMYM